MSGDPGDKPTALPHDPTPRQHSAALVPHRTERVPASARSRSGHEPSADAHALGSFKIEERQGWAVVVARGEIDLTTAPSLRHALEVASQTATRVVLDLNLVTFMDSSGIAVLLEAYKHRRLGHQMSLCLGGSGKMVRRVLEITRINTMLPIHDTLAEVIAKPT